MTLYDDGQISPCEVLESKLNYGNIRDFDYDFYELKKRSKIQKSYKNEIIKKKCNCDWQCAPPVNMLYDPPTYLKILKGFFVPGKLVHTFKSKTP